MKEKLTLVLEDPVLRIRIAEPVASDETAEQALERIMAQCQNLHFAVVRHGDGRGFTATPLRKSDAFGQLVFRIVGTSEGG